MDHFSNTTILTQRRGAVRGKANFVVNFVPQQEAWVVERMGKFHSILDPVSTCFNLNILLKRETFNSIIGHVIIIYRNC